MMWVLCKIFGHAYDLILVRKGGQPMTALECARCGETRDVPWRNRK